MKKTIFLLFALLVLLIAPVHGQKASYRWKNETNSLALLKTIPGQNEFTLWQLNFDPRLKPFFHPVCTPDGTLLTAEAPPDHLWHMGLWFCWKYINKLNYWEFTGDTKLAVSEGRTELKSIRTVTNADGGARIKMQMSYHPWDKPEEPVMTGTFNLLISRPSKDGSYSIKYDMTFKALTDVVLDRTPVQVNAAGVKWGGYAGLSMRFDQKLSDPHYFSATQDSVINGDSNSFVAANLKTPEGKTVQAVIFDNRSNPRYPSAWYTINRPNDRFWFFSPALLYHKELEMKAGEEMRLRYTVLVPAEPMNRERLKAHGSRLK